MGKTEAPTSLSQSLHQHQQQQHFNVLRAKMAEFVRKTLYTILYFVETFCFFSWIAVHFECCIQYDDAVKLVAILQTAIQDIFDI